MGRAFEYRKASKMKRWGAMSKAFTKIGKQIAIAVKAGGPNPEANSRLKILLQNAKGVSMPKDKVEGAIKRAANKELNDYIETIYEGYAAHGVAVLVECTTDNVNRTIASVRTAFSKGGGAIGTSGSVAFMFERKAHFKFPNTGQNVDDLELELIDFGLDEIFLDDEDNMFNAYSAFTDFAQMQKALEERGIEVASSEMTFLPTNTVSVTDEQMVDVDKLLEKLEEIEDVNNVYTNLG